MTGISHKLAQRYLRMDLDGLLSPAQHADLETHLRDCEACRREAEALSSLTTRLHTEFHARWDDHDGPSKQVLANVRSQTRRIMMQKRVDVVFNLLGGAAALLVLFLVINSVVTQLQKKSAASNGNQTATPAPLSQGKLIAFVSKQNGNNDIYTMNSDGSNIINLTNNPADDNFPVWSPDGTKIAFVSDRDGNENIYVMNFDGSALTRLTDDTGQDTNPLWSPDGTKIAYASGDFSKNNTNIYVIDTDGQNKKRLTNYVPNTTVSPTAWSPDSRFILFEVSGQIVQVNIQDNSLTPLTPQVADSMFTPTYLVLSTDGSTLTYLTECDQRERGNSGFCKKVQSIQRYGTQVRTAQDTLRILNICELKDPSQTLAYSWQTKWSPDHTKIISAFFCEGHGGLFYIANADGSDFKRLINDPVLNKTVDFDWSYDSQSIVLTSTLDNSNQDGLSTLNINDALANSNIRPTPLHTSAAQVSWLAWQPVPNYEAVILPTPEPDKTSVNNRLIAFTSEKDGNAEIYTVKPDGSDLKNLTNNPLAKDTNPVWSPDGKLIAYESELNGFTQLYLMNADGTHAMQLTSDQANHAIGGRADSNSNLWSPDGSKLIISQQSNDNQDNWTLYVLNINTGQKTQLFNQPIKYWDATWSPDGNHIAFIPIDPQHPEISRLYVVDANGDNLSELTKTLPSDQTWNDYPGYYWAPDGQSIFFITSNANYVSQNGLGGDNNNIYKWQVYQANLNGTLLQNASTHSPIGGWWQGTYFVLPLGGNSAWNWVRPDGTTPVNPFNKCQYASGATYNYKQSLNGNVVVSAMCSNSDWWLFKMDSSGTTFTPLLNTPLRGPDGGTNFSWSDDDKFLAVTLTTPKQTDMYILNVAESQKDPSMQPIKVSMGGGQLFYTGAWQPVENNDVVKEIPTPAPSQTSQACEKVTYIVQANDTLSSIAANYNVTQDAIKAENGLVSDNVFLGSTLVIPLCNRSETPEPTKTSSYDGLIAFVSDQDGNKEIYTIKSDGSDMTNLTNNPANDFNPVWSPDGSKIAFESERNHNTDIYIMNADGSNLHQLTTEPSFNGSATWSPDGQKIAYLSSTTKDSNKGSLYVINVDGSNKIALTKEKGNYSIRGWSPDSQTILYAMQVGDSSPTGYGYFAIDADGTNPRQLLKGGSFVSPIHWVDTQHFVTSVYTSAWRLYQFSIDGSAPINIGDAASPINAWFWGEPQITYAVKSWQDWQWYTAAPRIDSTKQKPFSTWKHFPKDCKQYINDLYMGSPQAVTSPNGKEAIVNVHCDEGGSWLYLVNADGSLIKSLTNSAIFQETNIYVYVSPWSLDSKQVLLTTDDNQGHNDLYILNVDEALQDPSTPPLHLANVDGMLSASWQPVPNNDVAQVNPTPKATLSFRFGEPVETKEQALIAAHAPMNGSFNYVGTPVVVKVQKGSPQELSNWVGSTSPAPKQVWVVVYYDEAWKSTFVASSKFAYDENGAVVTLPPDILTPPPPFRGCVIVEIDASNGHPVSVGPLQQYLIPECDK